MEQLNKSPQDRSPSRSDLENLCLRSVLGGLALTIFFLAPFTASAGTLRKPPNNLGLVAYWPFNEGDGLVAGDASGNGHTGTFTTTTSPVWTSGKLGNGLDAVNLTTGGLTNKVAFSNITTGTTYTISAWIYLTSDCTNYGAIFAEDTVEGLYCNRQAGRNKLDFWSSGTPADHFSNTPLALNRWYHVAIVNSAGSATFYLNGVADGTASSIPSFNANIMGNDTGAEYLPGKVDEVRFYSRALSASDVYALYKSGAVRIGRTNSYASPGTLASGLTGYWTFDGKDMVQNVADVSGNGRNGRLTGFTSTTTAPGKVGQGLNFDGANDYVNTTTVSQFFSAATGTVSVWVRPTGNATNVSSAAGIYGGQNAVSCSCIASWGITRANRTDLGQDRIWVWAYSTSLVGIPYNVGEWTHITLVHANSILKAYKNGDLVGVIGAGSFGSFSGTLTMGIAWTGVGGYWRGDLDEVRTYSRDLSASEIKQLYNLTAGTKVNKPSVNSLTSGLVGYYTFDGGDTDWSTNTMTNRGSLGGTGTLTGLSATTTPTRGKVGQGLTFVTGGTDYVDLGTSASLMPGTGNFSASIWVKADGSVGSNGFIGGKSTAFQPWWDIRGGDAQVSNSTQTVDKTYTFPSGNEWHHVVMVLDRTPSPDTLTVYLDGVSQGSATGTLDGQNVSGSGNVYIGRGSWATPANFTGSLDEARVYNRTLSAAEVLQLYHMGK